MHRSSSRALTSRGTRQPQRPAFGDLRHNGVRRNIAVLIVFAWLFCSCGCDRTADVVDAAKRQDDGSLAVSADLSAESTLDETLAAYRRLESYEDDAQVVLEYISEGQRHRDTAPLAIGWERGGKIGLRVYSVAAAPNDARWNLRLKRDDFGTENQVISRALPPAIDLAWLLDDPIVSQHLAAGIAGFPPQLNLLFGDEPLRGLLDSPEPPKFIEANSVDGRACYGIEVGPSDARYRLLIDKASMLLRRIELPRAGLPRELLANQSISQVKLWIDFAKVRTDRSVDWGRFAVQPAAQDIHVTHFVASAPNIDTQGVGRQLPAFQLIAPDGQIAFRGVPNGRRKATVLLWLADHPACHVAAQQLATSLAMLKSDQLTADIDVVCIWSEPQPPTGLSFSDLAKQWDLPGVLALDSQAIGRDLFGISEAPTLVLLDAQNRIQFRESQNQPLLDQRLALMLRRVVSGEDVAQQVLADRAAFQARREVELRMAASIDNSNPIDIQDNVYPPTLAALSEAAVIQFDSQTIASGLDSSQAWWRFDAEGSLQRFAPRIQTRNPEVEYQPGWQVDSRGQLLISASARFVALVVPSSPTIEVFDCEQKVNRTIRMDADAGALSSSAVDVRWLSVRGDPHPRLAVLTNRQRIMLLDPRNQQQMSGECPSAPLAILIAPDPQPSVNGRVVLADGTVHPIVLSESQTTDSSTPGRAVSFKATETKPADSKLEFLPAAGTWDTQIVNDNQALTLAQGWIAKDEPGVFLLDNSLTPLWHHRMALASSDSLGVGCSSAIDPTTGLATWLVQDALGTLHLLRSDGLVDHFRLSETPADCSLEANGDQLWLRVATPKELRMYSISWR